MTNEPHRLYFRPADRSLDAYREWLEEFARAFGLPDDRVSDAEWEESWRRFWGAADGHPSKQE